MKVKVIGVDVRFECMHLCRECEKKIYRKDRSCIGSLVEQSLSGIRCDFCNKITDYGAIVCKDCLVEYLNTIPSQDLPLYVNHGPVVQEYLDRKLRAK